MHSKPDYLTSAEAADLARVTVATVLCWINSGSLPAAKLRSGRSFRWRILRSDLLARIEVPETPVPPLLPLRPEMESALRRFGLRVGTCAPRGAG